MTRLRPAVAGLWRGRRNPNLAPKARSHYKSATGRIHLGEPGAKPESSFSAKGALSLQAWGNAPGMVKPQNASAESAFHVSLLHHVGIYFNAKGALSLLAWGNAPGLDRTT
jgi:hypothetical protein